LRVLFMKISLFVVCGGADGRSPTRPLQAG